MPKRVRHDDRSQEFLYTQRMYRVLAIETSCDETAAAVVEGDGVHRPRALSNTIASQIAIHAEYGGVFPDVAAREHTKRILPVLSVALKEAGLTDRLDVAGSDLQTALESIDAIAVTNGPGLIGPLLVGTSAAIQLAALTGKPLIPINHWEGHIYSAFLQKSESISNDKFLISKQNPKPKTQNNDVITSSLSLSKDLVGSSIINHESSIMNGSLPAFPLLALTVSGGHTSLILMRDHFSYEILGSTVDDAAGEAFDKTARLLGLPYPGGPKLSAHAADARKVNAKLGIDLPRPMMGVGSPTHYNLPPTHSLDFSFSGLKTAVRYAIDRGDIVLPADIDRAARAIEDAIVDVLIGKLERAIKHIQPKSVAIVGGVSANQELRCRFGDLLTPHPSRFTGWLAEGQFTTDNAAMIGSAAIFHLARQHGILASPFDLVTNPSLRLS